MKRAVFYCRVSTNHLEQKQSLENQTTFFNNFLDNNNDYVRVPFVGQLSRHDGTDEPRESYYSDEGLTATKTNFKNRRAFNQMIKDAHAKKFDIIFVKSLSRFSRSLETTVKVLKDLKEINVAVFFDDLKINSLDSSSEFMINMFSSIHQEDSRIKSDSVSFGIKRANESGKWTFKPPYGYQKIEGHLYLCPNESKVVKQIFDWYLNESMGVQTISKKLDSMGIMTRSGKAWIPSTVAKVLNNQICTGKMQMGKTRKIDINRNTSRKTTQEEQIIINNEELRIISDEMFTAVQLEKEERMKRQNTFSHVSKQRENQTDVYVSGSRFSSKNLLSNLFYCGNCNSVMKRRKNYQNKNDVEPTYHYICTTYQIKGSHACVSNRIQESKLRLLLNEEIKRKQQEDLTDNLNTIIETQYNLENQTEEVERLNSEVSKLKKRRVNLNTMRADGELSKEEHNESLAVLNEELTELEQKLQIKLNLQLEIDKLKEKYEEFIATLKSIKEDNLSNALLKKVISSIHITTLDEEIFTQLDEPTGISVYWRFMDLFEEDVIDMSVKLWNKKYEDSLTDEQKEERERKMDEFLSKYPDNPFD
ncbi:recombinase family protein [Paenibacillus anseongense]|uniref:recombinase family protein n=1 Tax=Paenibacillus anseongense TaxID=2682845 RepID=UPI002DBB50D2|nr:recombinase family protein [Paenibacillus anseongense]MEC0265120.1 recombinase family protein [Paenibacillus anseongense]